MIKKRKANTELPSLSGRLWLAFIADIKSASLLKHEEKSFST